MSPKVVLSDGAHGDSHPTFYKGNHWDYHFSLLPFLVPFSFLIIPNEDSWWDSILSFKAFYILCRVYQVGKSTHS